MTLSKIADYLHSFPADTAGKPQGICWVRVFDREGETPVVVLSELPQNLSASVTDMAEYLAPEMVRRHFPHRFEAIPPVIFLEHYVEQQTPQGRLGRKATWDRLSFHSWAPRRSVLAGNVRLAYGEPHWEGLPEHEVEALIGRAEMRALPPDIPTHKLAGASISR